jgi:lipid-A-disaccharide synthase-like uncharacterized protein
MQVHASVGVRLGNVRVLVQPFTLESGMNTPLDCTHVTDTFWYGVIFGSLLALTIFVGVVSFA